MPVLLSTITSQTKSQGTYLNHPEYRPDIDGLRALAILSVLLYHAFPQALPGGFSGVDVFFVISGFLISGIILRETERGPFSFINFYSRRARRLFPALTLVLCITWIFGWLVLLPEELQRLGAHTAAGALFSLNILLFWSDDSYGQLGQQQLGHLWSLGVEEQFYLLWPLLLVMGWRLGKRFAIFAMMAVIVTSFVVNVAFISKNPTASFYLPISRLWELALGGVVAYFTVRESERLDLQTSFLGKKIPHLAVLRVRHILGLVGLALVIASFVGLHRTWEHPGVQGLAPTLGSVMLIAAGPKSFFNRMFLARPAMVLIGLISYPLYLWHWPLLSFAQLIEQDRPSAGLASGIIVAAFALAYITYRYVELPIRRSPHKSRTVIALCTGIAVCGAVGILTLSQSIPGRPRPSEVARFEPVGENWLTGTASPSWRPVRPGYLFVGAGSRQVVYVGDSFMQQYYPRIAKLLEDHPQNSRSAVFAVRGACAPMLETDSAFGRTPCIQHGRNAINYAKRPNVDAIVIGAAWFGYLTDFDGHNAVLRTDVDEILAPLRKAIIELRQESKQVYIVLASPFNGKLDARKMIRRTIVPPGFRLQISPAPSVKEIEKLIGPTNAKLIELAHEVGANVINPTDSLCNELTCPSISREGLSIYTDGCHLRPSYARMNAGYLDETILDAQLSRARL